MENISFESEDLNKYHKEKEYIANSYVMRCFSVTIALYFLCFILNLLDIFIINKDLMLMGFIPSMIIYAVMLIIANRVSLSSRK